VDCEFLSIPAASVTASCQSRSSPPKPEKSDLDATYSGTDAAPDARTHPIQEAPVNGNQSPPSHRLDRRAFVGLTGASAAVLLTACNGGSETVSNASGDDAVAMRINYEPQFAQFEPADEPEGDPEKVVWPDFVLASPPEVQELYAFHVTSGGLMRYMPCYCGCKGSGHRNNRDCYVQEVHADGSIVFDSMAPT